MIYDDVTVYEGDICTLCDSKKSDFDSVFCDRHSEEFNAAWDEAKMDMEDGKKGIAWMVNWVNTYPRPSKNKVRKWITLTP